MTRRRDATRDDDGQVLVLVIGVAVLAIAIAVTLAAVSGILLERKRLVSVADNAAAHAAADVRADDVYGGIGDDLGGPRARTPRDVERSVAEYLDDGRLGIDGLEVVEVGTDGEVVVVVLRRTVRPWLVGAFADVLGGEGVIVEGTGRARPVDGT